MEKEGYIERRRKKLDEIRGKYNPAPELCDTEPYRYHGMDFAEKLISMEDDGIASIIEFTDLMQGTDTVIDFSDGVYEINSSVYQNTATPADEDLRRLIADTIGLEKQPATPVSQSDASESPKDSMPCDNIGMVNELAALLAGTGSPYAAVIAKEGNAFSDVFAPGFGSAGGSVFNFPVDGEVCTQILSKRRTLIINSSFCELTELTGLIPDMHLKHISSCCLAPLGADSDGRYLFFAFDSTVISADNVKNIIKKINNIPVLA